MTAAFPLSWPDTIRRHPAMRRETGQFRTSLSGALVNVRESLRRFAKDSGKPMSGLVISSNCSLGVSSPEDPGVAVWFVWDNIPVCMPVDRYTKPSSNLQAIHHIIEARRTELRHGTLELVRATMAGLSALPPPGGERPAAWFQILGVRQQATPSQIQKAYRERAQKAHPDHGGSNAQMATLNHARDEGLSQ